MATLKLKNATPDIFGFNYRCPESGQLVTRYAEPMSTIELFKGDVDQCSAIRLQYPNLLDSDEALLSECPVQFVWEDVLPTLEDYQGSLEKGELDTADNAMKELTDTVTDTASGMTEESNLTVQRAGSRKGVTANGTQV
ncbi:hypothetical protein UFOVP136_36 [uncultured Caudovirales phage]|uniref:Uncharacterized protein n=1 Tax=uncultured Caudovirales phage TaxID=2100421 RepID=A0A6J5LCW5_9CAUD|nr:hypothetical protein UFOVP136_36 [uncultured Caudovirales phage]